MAKSIRIRRTGGASGSPAVGENVEVRHDAASSARETRDGGRTGCARPSTIGTRHQRRRPTVVARAQSGHATEAEEHAGIVPMIAAFGGHVRLALACGAVVAMLGGPLAADECSDYRTAFLLYEVAEQAWRKHFDTPHLHAMNRARSDLHDATRAVRRAIADAPPAIPESIADKPGAAAAAATDAIDAIDAVRAAIVEAARRVSKWNELSSIVGQGGMPYLYGSLTGAGEKALAAYHEALHSVCRARTP